MAIFQDVYGKEAMTEPHPTPPPGGFEFKKVQLSIGSEGLIDSIIDYLKSALSADFLSIALDGVRLKPPLGGFIQSKVIPWKKHRDSKWLHSRLPKFWLHAAFLFQ